MRSVQRPSASIVPTCSFDRVQLRQYPKRQREHLSGAALPSRSLLRLGVTLLLGATLSLTQACRRELPATSEVQHLDSLPTPPPLALSRFNVPLTYDYTPILELVEKSVPKQFGSLDSVKMVGNDENRHYAYEANRGPFTSFVRDNQVHLRATLTYAARGYFKPRFGPTIGAGCGGDTPADRPRIAVELVTPLTISPDWHLDSHARIATLAPATNTDRDKCTVSIIRYDVTERVVGAARSALLKHLPEIDRKIDNVDLSSRFQEWWTLLNRPIQLADSVWLRLDPEQLRIGDVSQGAAPRTFVVDAGLDAHPRIVTGPQPQIVAKALPPLARDTAASGFRVVLEGTIDYATASRSVAVALRGKSITEASRTVTVRDASVSPLPHGQLALAISFSGDADGSLVFIGTPHYDRQGGELSVPNLDYDLSTDNALITAYSWLKSDALRALFRDKARIPVQPLLDAGKSLLTEGMNRKLGDNVTLSAKIDSVDVASIYVTKQGIVVRAIAIGNAGMQVQQH